MTREKSRHGCLTTWLIFMMIVNALGAFGYLLGGQAIKQTIPNAPVWLLPVLIVVSVFNIICAFAIYRWQKWGFWGFLGSSVAAFVINLSIGLGLIQSFLGLVGIAILYGILNIGKNNKGWSQLE